MEKHLHMNSLVPEDDQGIVEHEVLRCVHKLREGWNEKRELFEESKVQAFEAGGRDPTNDRFQER
jgi:hypothetical protein